MLGTSFFPSFWHIFIPILPHLPTAQKTMLTHITQPHHSHAVIKASICLVSHGARTLHHSSCCGANNTEKACNVFGNSGTCVRSPTLSTQHTILSALRTQSIACQHHSIRTVSFLVFLLAVYFQYANDDSLSGFQLHYPRFAYCSHQCFCYVPASTRSIHEADVQRHSSFTGSPTQEAVLRVFTKRWTIVIFRRFYLDEGTPLLVYQARDLEGSLRQPTSSQNRGYLNIPFALVSQVASVEAQNQQAWTRIAMATFFLNCRVIPSRPWMQYLNASLNTAAGIWTVRFLICMSRRYICLA